MKVNKKLYIVVSVVVCLNILLSGFILNETDAAGDLQEKYVLHIVLDGLSDKLFEDVKKEGVTTPNIDMLIENGTRLKKLSTTVPSYGGAQAGLVTGASPAANEFLYRYYDKKTNQVLSKVTDTQKIVAETIFEAIERQSPHLKTLALGMHVDNLSLDGRGIYIKGDPDHKLIEYSQGDNLISFVSGERPVGDEIIDSELLGNKLSNHTINILVLLVGVVLYPFYPIRVTQILLLDYSGTVVDEIYIFCLLSV